MRSYLSVLWVAAGLAAAQDIPTASLRLLALGELPPFRQEIRDGVRRELDPPEGSLPPRVLEAGLQPAAAKDAKPPAFRLQLALPSPPAKVFPVADKVTLRDPANGDWAEVPCPAGAKVLAILWRPADSWRNPAVLALPELTADHDPRAFRFVNVAAQTVGVVFGERRYQLQVGKVLSLTLPEQTKAASVSILMAGPGDRFTPCFSGLAEAKPGMATQFFVHRADGDKPRRPINVTPVSGPLASP
jgi:hypothetical protein